MALSVSTQVSPVGSKLVIETAAGSSSSNNVIGTSTIIYMIEIDNTANSVASYLKIYNNAAPTVGTTAPDLIFMTPSSSSLQCVFPRGLVMPILSFACVTTSGNAGATAPSSPVIVRIVCG